jgi:GNAT superfamily N-acetyltransferase
LADRVLIERFDAADEVSARALYEVYAAGAPVDEPGSPAMSLPVWRGLMTCGWCAEPRESWIARAEAAEPGEAAGAVLGGYLLELPDQENRDRAGTHLLVAPGRRRAGTGSALLRHALARAAEVGRGTLFTHALEGTPGDGFARAMGASADLTEVRRTLDVAAIPAGHLARLRAAAEGAAAGYTLTAWDGLTPEEWLEPVARLNEAMADAPHGDGEEPQVWNGDRVRLVDQLSLDRGLRRYSIAAAESATGELAALTQLSFEDAEPAWGHQEMTAVARAHRGHRLGLLTKVAMMEMLAIREPRLAFVETWNGESNAHMVAINETLGFRRTGRVTVWTLSTAAAQSRPPTDAMAPSLRS